MRENQLKLKEQLRFLSEAMFHLKTLDEYENFLNDILSNQEIEMIAQRLCVAILLFEGDTFRNITDKTGVSSATIERVKQSFLYGKDGYRTVIKRLKDNESFCNDKNATNNKIHASD